MNATARVDRELEDTFQGRAAVTPWIVALGSLDLPGMPRELVIGMPEDLDLLIASGVRADVAATLIERLGGVAGIAVATPAELRAAGVSPTMSERLAAALSLGRRFATSAADAPTVLGCPEDAHKLLAHRVAGLQQEVFYVIAVNIRNVVIDVIEIARGTVHGVEVHPREVFRPAIRLAAAGIVLAHNHPSGDPTPSAEDIALTRRLKEAGDLLGIPVVDHVVVTAKSFRSISEWAGADL